jgi:hypothetical protein
MSFPQFLFGQPNLRRVDSQRLSRRAKIGNLDI